MNPPTSKQIEVQIMGQSYLLACPEDGESALLDAVERVDTAMCRIRDAGKVRARDRIAVLASLNIAFELSQKEIERHSEAADTPPSAESPELDAALASATPVDPHTQSRVDDLIRRIDRALEDDGEAL
ncbi:MAG: cell division protein ZapA [Hydrogenophaga sp.]|jgi:cell division protein ZapA|nr:cell division protein ZapA [Hydrogenophaga sp.]